MKSGYSDHEIKQQYNQYIMKHKQLSVMLAAIGLMVSGMSYAGVVPQYRFEKAEKAICRLKTRWFSRSPAALLWLEAIFFRSRNR